MSEDKKVKLLAEYGELSLKMETAQKKVKDLQQVMQIVKQEIANLLKAEETQDEASGD